VQPAERYTPANDQQATESMNEASHRNQDYAAYQHLTSALGQTRNQIEAHPQGEDHLAAPNWRTTIGSTTIGDTIPFPRRSVGL